MILVDSSVWIDYFNGQITRQTNTLDSLIGRELIVVGDLILTEVLQGFRNDKEFNKAGELLSGFIFKEMLGKEMAIKSARNYRILRKNGVTVRKTIDVIIATLCIEHDLSLLHSDRDFKAMEEYLNLRVIL